MMAPYWSILSVFIGAGIAAFALWRLRDHEAPDIWIWVALAGAILAAIFGAAVVSAFVLPIPAG